MLGDACPASVAFDESLDCSGRKTIYIRGLGIAPVRGLYEQCFLAVFAFLKVAYKR